MFAHFHQRLKSLVRIRDQVAVKGYAARLKKRNSSATAKLKVTFFVALVYFHPWSIGLNNASDHESTNFHAYDFSEQITVDFANRSFVQAENWDV